MRGLYNFLALFLLLCRTWSTASALSAPTPTTKLSLPTHETVSKEQFAWQVIRGGGFIPAGYHPMGYQITALGEKFLEFGSTSRESDIGRFLVATRKRKTMATIKSEWLEIVRAAKTGQAMRIYRTLQELIDFCIKAGLLD